jgi:integrase
MRERPPGSGSWQLRVFAGPDQRTGKPRQVSRTFHGTEKAASKELAQFVAEVASGRLTRTSATVGQLLDRWLEHTALRHRPRTVYENRVKIEQRIRPVIGHIRLDRLGADTLDAAYNGWLADGLSPATVHKYHSVIAAALNAAVKWGWIDRSPASRASPPSPVKRDMSVPTPERLAKLISLAEGDDPVVATAIALAALTGARRGELVGLRWSDVDLDAGRVRIARSVVHARGELHVGPTKTHQIRLVALDEIGVEVLRRHRAYVDDLALRAQVSLAPDPYVLSYTVDGSVPAGPDTFTHRFGALCRKMDAAAAKRKGVAVAKLPPDERWGYRFHDLRHFSATMLVAAGVDVRTVASRLGHSQPTLTLNLYAHALPERDRHAAAVLGGMLAQSGGGSAGSVSNKTEQATALTDGTAARGTRRRTPRSTHPSSV